MALLTWIFCAESLHAQHNALDTSSFRPLRHEALNALEPPDDAQLQQPNPVLWATNVDQATVVVQALMSF